MRYTPPLAAMADAIEGIHYVIYEGRICPVIRGGDGPDDEDKGGGDDAGDKGGGDDAGDKGKGDGGASGKDKSGADKGSDDKGTAEGKGADDKSAEKGFPANTPLAEMTDAQRSKYWEFHAKKHEKRGNETFAELEKIRKANLTASERAIEEAKEAGRKEGRDASAPKLVAASITAAAAGRLDQAVLDSLVGSIDHSKLLDAEGDVDTAKVAALVESLAKPVKGGKFPDLGQGRREGAATGSKADAGKAEAERRFGKPA